MTPGQWLDELQNILGHSIFPKDYIVFDVETTGRVFYGANGQHTPVNNGHHDLITQIGHCVVRDGEAKHKGGVILDWTDESVHALHEFEVMGDSEWIRAKLEYLERVFEERGRTYQVPFDKMKSEGENPVEVLAAYYDMFQDAREKGMKFVGHNAWGFDVKMVRYHFRQYLDKDFAWEHDEIIDTGMLEKAIQERENLYASLPWSTENLKTWSRRQANSPRAGVKWNLDQHVVGKYDLVKRYNLDMVDAHDASFDCYITHLLLKSLEELYKDKDKV
jgi:DNA polymerase III epsilon subunit-like protein